MSSTEPRLELEEFEVRPRRSPAPAVSEVSLRLEPGERLLVTGVEDSGKTSLLRGILGLVPHGGTARVVGALPGSAVAKAGTGYGPAGRPFLSGLRVREQVALMARVRRIPDADHAIDEVLERCGLQGRGATLVRDLDVEGARRTSLACAEIGLPDLVLLDDPWESPETFAVLDAARQRGAGVVLATDQAGGFPRAVDATLALVDRRPA